MPPPPRVIEVKFPTFSSRLVQGVILVIFLLLAAWGSFYTVPADSSAIVQRFGQYLETKGPGLQFKMPLGIDTATILRTTRPLKMEFGFGQRRMDLTNPDQVGDQPELERAMVTGDLNAALVEWVVQYRIADPRLYLFQVRDPGQTLRDLSESVMREVVGDRTVDEVITIGRQEIESVALERLNELSKKYELGVLVDQVQLQDVNPPAAVRDSFNEVNKAQQDKESAINLATGDYNKAIPRAKGEADQKARAAEGYRSKRINEAQGDASAFNAVFTEYQKAPEVTRTRLYLEAMAEVLPNAGPKIIVDDSMKQILPLLQTNPGAAQPLLPATTPRR